MRARPMRLLTAVVTAGIAVGGLSACGLTRENFEDDTTLSQKVTSVRLATGSGGVVLRGKEGATEVKVHRYVEYGGDRPEGATHRVENGVLVLDDCGKDCSVAYTVELPAGLPVTGGTSSGAVKLAGTGAVKVTTDSGAIDLFDVKGAVDVQADSGAITGRGLKGGPVEARADSGAVTLTLASPQDVRAEADSGAVTLTTPSSGRYRVTAETDSGGKDIAVSDDPSGTHRLRLRTDSGAIKVKSS
ncbi:DUF4097 family beta strand repeat-containing protein [Streptomyces albireticuli]|uniref:DUF4097 domain-containing protein n=1 Tax=Streptomyces albireticuli TaxID=1940 RepID=A0A2A2CZT7_9ACTN|nr:DUF4097 family beta strand repeat-containing protein [Streptomyces albireticuli]MCD9145022.1 DUF4097 domain-containing protein [Streptomyces albireticuli]MCD9164448.1 DUF4097 domain-containing protein [Streptomyces albireticuli]MCD9194159.1 DUF4097 domain-containing protein [Streptomyces albireticuli]PAU44791.1 hypothetical protein CK936_32970 [Streptomyces albireticuli]